MTIALLTGCSVAPADDDSATPSGTTSSSPTPSSPTPPGGTSPGGTSSGGTSSGGTSSGATSSGATSSGPSGTPSPSGSPSSQESPGSSDAPLLLGGQLVDALRQGGNILYIRHAATEATDDAPVVDLGDRSTQRNLSDEGRQQAEDIGDAVTTQGIPLGDVVSSPYARAVETAQIAFGAETVTTDDRLLYVYYQGVDRGALAQDLRRMLDEEPAPGTNTVLVGHGDNLVGAAYTQVDMGGAAVIDPAGGDEFAVLGLITPQDWAQLAEGALP